jgi:TolA-binding protein
MFVHYDTAIGSRGNDLDGGQPSNDIDYAAYKDTIHHTFRCLAGDTTDPLIPKLQLDDQLFIFVGDHGGEVGSNHSYIWLPKYHTKNKGIDTLMDTTLANWTSRINCGQMIFVLEECHSGGFIPYLKDSSIYNFKCKNRSIYTSVTQSQTEGFEYHISGGTYGEFIFYWTAAARGYFPDITHYKPWLTGFPVYDPDSYPVFPYANCFDTCQGHPYYSPDQNKDGVVTMEEAFSFAKDYDTWDTVGFFCPFDHHFANMPSAQHYKNICFKEDLQALSGLTGKITHTDTVENRSYVVGGPLKVDSNAILTFSNVDSKGINSRLYFINDSARLVVEAGSTLNPGTDMLFAGSDSNNVYILYAGMGPLKGVTFSNDTNDPASVNFGGLYLANIDTSTMDSVHFSHAGFVRFLDPPLTIKNNSTFKDCIYFDSQGGSITISNSTFDSTVIYLANLYESSAKAVIDSNTFSGPDIYNPYQVDMIDVNNFDNFRIKDNQISFAQYGGIGLYYCGQGTSPYQNILHDSITNCNVGVLVYNSNCVIQNNQISQNIRGVKSINTSNTQLIGKYISSDPSRIQEIYDNDTNQIYSADNSFPIYVRGNLIYKENDYRQCLIENDNTKKAGNPILDVRYNCWGDNSPRDQLCTNYGTYLYYPPSCDPDTPDSLLGPDEEMYNSADSLFVSGNYVGAKNLYISLIEQYPKSKYSESALKELFYVEQYAGDDYSGLQQYYLTTDSITADPTLSVIAEFLTNRCDVQMKNWPQAISWYQNRIMNPPSDVDSICAIIDLGNIYILMENGGNKPVHIGTLPYYKPTAVNRYRTYRDSLIALLPFKHKKIPLNNQGAQLKTNELLQNEPNPFFTTSDIWYKLAPNCNRVTINITDYLGRIRRSIDPTDNSEGTHKITIDASGLTPGIYYYSLDVNGRKSDTKKMVVIR